ncbi:MAG: hypothetical protein ACO379_02715 [Burkholderiaceae bacterium]
MISSRGLAVLGLDVRWVPRGVSTGHPVVDSVMDEVPVARIHIQGPWPNPRLRRLVENMLSMGLGDHGLALDWTAAASDAQGIEIAVTLAADQFLHAGLPSADQIFSALGKRAAWSALCALRRDMREASASAPLQS